MNKRPISYFYGSFAVMFIGIFAGFCVDGMRGAQSVVILSILEISLSLDNAVVNAKILKHWNNYWRQMFLWVGVIIAVFGMRILFPILIASITTGMGFWEVVDMATYRPEDYAHALEAAHHEINGFGGAFLLMVALQFFVKTNKEKHWLAWIEKPLEKVGKVDDVNILITLVSIYTISRLLLEGAKIDQFFFAGVVGLMTYVAIKGLGSVMSNESEDEGGYGVVKQGIIGFLFIEVLDASFSLDGVAGALAISSNLYIIGIGLGVGAMFVRSMTIYLVANGTLDKLRYLEHGAFWAIVTLVVIMFVGVKYHVPEVAGLVGAALIIGAGIHSWLANRRDRLNGVAVEDLTEDEVGAIKEL